MMQLRTGIKFLRVAVQSLFTNGKQNTENTQDASTVILPYTIHFRHILQIFYSEIPVVAIDKLAVPQPAITCSKLTIETLEQGVKYVQS